MDRLLFSENFTKKTFRDKKRRGNIDIWWLYDDGGLPILISHVLQVIKLGLHNKSA